MYVLWPQEKKCLPPAVSYYFDIELRDTCWYKVRGGSVLLLTLAYEWAPLCDTGKTITITTNDEIHSYSDEWFFNIKKMLIKDSIWIMCTNTIYQFSICYHGAYFPPPNQLSIYLHIGAIFTIQNDSSGDAWLSAHSSNFCSSRCCHNSSS